MPAGRLRGDHLMAGERRRPRDSKADHAGADDENLHARFVLARVLAVEMRHQGSAVARAHDGFGRTAASMRARSAAESLTSSAVIALASCIGRLAPMSGMTSLPRDATQAIASSAVLQPFSLAIACSAATSARLRARCRP